jgi:hypothetical protein
MRKLFIVGVVIAAAVVLSGSTAAQAGSCEQNCAQGCAGKGNFLHDPLQHELRTNRQGHR